MINKRITNTIAPKVVKPITSGIKQWYRLNIKKEVPKTMRQYNYEKTHIKRDDVANISNEGKAYVSHKPEIREVKVKDKYAAKDIIKANKQQYKSAQANRAEMRKNINQYRKNEKANAGTKFIDIIRKADDIAAGLNDPQIAADLNAIKSQLRRTDMVGQLKRFWTYIKTHKGMSTLDAQLRNNITIYAHSKDPAKAAETLQRIKHIVHKMDNQIVKDKVIAEEFAKHKALTPFGIAAILLAMGTILD